MSEERQGHVNYTPNLHFFKLPKLFTLSHNHASKENDLFGYNSCHGPYQGAGSWCCPPSNHEKSKASKVVLDSHLEEPEGSPIDLGSEMNPSINHVQVVGQGTAEYTTQDTFNAFISDDYAFKEEMQSTVNGLSLELRSIKELILNTVG